MHDTLPLQISFSGGRTSAFMTKFCKEYFAGRELHILFYNTGKERLETLDFVNECDRRWNLGVTWLESKFNGHGVGVTATVVNYETASRNGEPFEAMIRKFGIPNMIGSTCTRELKERLGKAYMRQQGIKQYVTAIGIRADERHRINPTRAAKERLIYPLADIIQTDKAFIRNWWDRQDFDLKLKDYEGNCDLCWKKSDRKLFTIIQDRPELANWWNRMETEHGNGQVFYRKHRSTADMIELAATGNYTPAVDEHEASKAAELTELDIERDCFCKTS